MRNGLIQRAETFAKRWRDFESKSLENEASAKAIAQQVLNLREQAASERDYTTLRQLLAPHQEELGLQIQKNRCFRLWFEAIAFHLIQSVE